MAEIKYIKGNIFDSECQTLVNTVNCVGFMGKGIALEYKYRYPEMFESYKKICEKKLLKPGLLHLYDESQPWILNFPTKIHYKDPSEIEYIELGLKKFGLTYRQKGIKSIAFPHLGCSQGGLSFDTVKPIMERYLAPLDNIKIEIFEFDPNARDLLFEKLSSQLKELDASQYQKTIGLKLHQALILEEILKEKRISSMFQLNKIKGLGKKSVSKIYDFIQNEQPKENYSGKSEDQQTLPF